MKKLWQKEIKINKLVDEYCFSDGVILDNDLVSYDIYGSIAHAYALFKLEIINKEELIKLINCLKKILDLYSCGKFIVKHGDEDVHTKVEHYLTQELGDIGKKIHTARSRNDQILVDLRLFSKDKLFQIIKVLIYLTETLIKFAEKYEFVPIPGYTHMQKAMPSTVGMWAASFVESLLDDLIILKAAYGLNDQSPLGSGAAYGVSLPLDRELTAKLLGFSKVQNNSLYCQASRCKIHLTTISALVQVMLTLSRLAEDILLFTTSEFDFFKVSPELCTGSSIMPQKKNLDVMEYLRAKTQTVIGYQNIVASISSGLPSGYNADFGETKEPLMKAFKITWQSLQVADVIIKNLKPNTSVLNKAMSSEIFAVHAAYELVKKGIPFRQAYLEVAKSLKNLPSFDVNDVSQIIQQSKHLGGTGNLGLKKLKVKLMQVKNYWQEKESAYHAIVATLLK